jgi:hypothetical protein
VLKESSFGADHVAEFQVPVTAFNSYLFHIYSIGRAGVTFRLFTRPDATYAQRIDKNMATDVWEYTPKESGTVRLELETDQNTPATVDIAAYRLDTTAPLLRLFHVQ